MAGKPRFQRMDGLLKTYILATVLDTVTALLHLISVNIFLLFLPYFDTTCVLCVVSALRQVLDVLCIAGTRW